MGQVAQGRHEPLETLMRRHASPVLTFIHRMLGNRHRAEELFQEVFLAIWIKRSTYKLEQPFRCWLYAIAANCCRVELRRRPSPVTTSNEILSAEVVADGKTPVDSVLTGEIASMIESAIADLPVRQRTVVVMRIWNQMSFAEIANAIESTEGTARSHMHHALKSLRQRLQRHLAPAN